MPGRFYDHWGLQQNCLLWYLSQPFKQLVRQVKGAAEINKNLVVWLKANSSRNVAARR
jgi:hypothetical protein